MRLAPHRLKSGGGRLMALRGGRRGGGSSGLLSDYSAIEWAGEDVGEGFPATGRDARHVKTHLDNYKLLDFSPLLNTASYVNVVAEREEEEVALSGLKVNIADQTIYPGSFKLHNDALNMLGDLWHLPKSASFDEYGCHAGACTVGSTEACLLAGLALKFRWRKWYAARHGLSEAEVRSVYPNLVISTMSILQHAWFDSAAPQRAARSPAYRTRGRAAPAEESDTIVPGEKGGAGQTWVGYGAGTAARLLTSLTGVDFKAGGMGAKGGDGKRKPVYRAAEVDAMLSEVLAEGCDIAAPPMRRNANFGAGAIIPTLPSGPAAFAF